MADFNPLSSVAQKCSSINLVCFKTLRAGSRDRVHTCVLGMVMVRCHTGADNGEEDSKYLQPGLGPCGHANTADTGCAAASKTYTLSHHRDTATLLLCRGWAGRGYGHFWTGPFLVFIFCIKQSQALQTGP